MEFLSAAILIVCFTGIVLFVEKYRKNKEAPPVEKATLCLINRYYNYDGGIQESLEGLPVDSALETGQELLWDKAAEFNRKLPAFVLSEDASGKQVEDLFLTAVSIVKTASLMQMIHSTNESFKITNQLEVIVPEIEDSIEESQ